MAFFAGAMAFFAGVLFTGILFLCARELLWQLKGIRALTVCKYYNISRLLGHLFYAKHTFWVDRFHNLIGKK